MLSLILMLLLTWAVLVALVTGWSMWFQGAIYTEPAEGMVWRGPAAATAIMAVVVLWVVLDYQALGRYRPIWQSASNEGAPSFPELRVPGGADREVVYKLRPGTRQDYRDASNRPLPGTPTRLIVVEDGERSVFEPERDGQGNFLRRKTGSGPADPLRYLDARGRVMREGQLGQLEEFSRGQFFANLLLNGLFVATCFLSLWLLAQYQWAHALGQALVVAAAMMVFVLPPILSHAESVAQARRDAASKPAG